MARTQGAAAKGPGPGRPKGARNKITRDIQQAILNAFEKAGGENYLARIAEEDPKTFCALLGKVLPMQVSGEGGGPVALTVTWVGE